MTNAYCDLATLKSAGALNLAGSVYDLRLLALLEEASRWIDGYCNRHFYVLHATRRFDVSWWMAGRGQLPVPDLISVASLHTRPGHTRLDDTRSGAGAAPVAWAETDYRLYPLNAAPEQPWGRPYTRLLANPDSPAQFRFPAGPDTVEIAGKWGFREVKEDSGTTIGVGAALAPADTRLTGAEGGQLSAGQTLAVGAEQLYVTAVDGVEATVARGVNGTVAASHQAADAIAVYRYPGPVTEACLQLAAQLWHCRDRHALPVGRERRPVGPGSGPGLSPAPELAGLLAAYRWPSMTGWREPPTLAIVFRSCCWPGRRIPPRLGRRWRPTSTRGEPGRSSAPWKAPPR